MIFDKKAELNVLINLAASDKNVADRETKLIQLIGQANGITKDEINEMLKNPQPIHSSSSLTPEEKFEHLYNLIQLMKMDGQVFRKTRIQEGRRWRDLTTRLQRPFHYLRP
jgi:hypothetical protein